MEIVKKFLKRSLSFLAGLPIPDEVLGYRNILTLFTGILLGMYAAWSQPTFVPAPVVVNTAAVSGYVFFLASVVFAVIDYARDYVADKTEEQ
jgi:hypothetical protein